MFLHSYTAFLMMQERSWLTFSWHKTWLMLLRSVTSFYEPFILNLFEYSLNLREKENNNEKSFLCFLLPLFLFEQCPVSSCIRLSFLPPLSIFFIPSSRLCPSARTRMKLPVARLDRRHLAQKKNTICAQAAKNSHFLGGAHSRWKRAFVMSGGHISVIGEEQEAAAFSTKGLKEFWAFQTEYFEAFQKRLNKTLQGKQWAIIMARGTQPLLKYAWALNSPCSFIADCFKVVT